jgi:GLPGLI family protein
MKNLSKLIFVVLIFANSSFILAQNFEGKAIYFSKMKFGDASSEIKSDKNPELTKRIEEALKSASEKTYCLSFNRYESIFEEEEKLESQGANGAGIKIMMSGQGKKYMNRKEKKQIFEDDILGKEFLVTDEITNWNWELKSETKNIGGYLCNKAEAIVKVSDAEKEDYEKYLKNKSKQKTSLMMQSEPKDNIITAWYTTEIPVNHGPDKYSGLPGLILEVNDNDVTLLCSKVVLNPKDKIKIKIPNVGVVITRKKFDKTQKDKMDSMKDKDGNIIIRNMRE